MVKRETKTRTTTTTRTTSTNKKRRMNSNRTRSVISKAKANDMARGTGGILAEVETSCRDIQHHLIDHQLA